MRLAVLCALLLAGPLAAQDLTGHGGPVSALAAAGSVVVSGGFDGRTILWNAPGASALRIERFHEGNVTAVALTGDGGFVSAGQDGRIALWQAGAAAPLWATPAEVAPVSALAVGPGQVAAGFVDGRIARIDLATGTMQTQPAHDGRVAGVAYLADGTLASVGGDLRFARWDDTGRLLARTGLPDLPNGLTPAGEALAIPFAEGALRLLSPQGQVLRERYLTETPLVAVAAGDGVVAAAAVDGAIWLLDLPTLTPRAELPGGAGPVWALALTGETLFAAGARGVIRRLSAQDGAALGAATAALSDPLDDGSRGAQVWRACAVCHSLDPGDHSRAGPSLHGLFGRRIASVAGYDFSPELRAMDIVWTPQTVAELFEVGPEAYTPGSRMPDQRVGDPADRQALIEYLVRFAP
ncbi:MAG: c-type cytochrome [Rhodobacterales bacterium]|nr:c-type cytochrome [Rhodobacterales bacterium]